MVAGTSCIKSEEPNIVVEMFCFVLSTLEMECSAICTVVQHYVQNK